MAAIAEKELTGGAKLIAPSRHVRLDRERARLQFRRLDLLSLRSSSARGRMQTVGQEAVVLSPYWDSGRPPTLSIYVGHTRAAGAPDPASLWHRQGTLQDAFAVFNADMPKYDAGVVRAFTRPLSQPQFDAAADFNYNTGAIEVADWVDLWNAGDFAAAERSFLANWRHPDARRHVEWQLFFHGEYATDGTALLIPADDNGRLDWSAANSIDISSYFGASA